MGISLLVLLALSVIGVIVILVGLKTGFFSKKDVRKALENEGYIDDKHSGRQRISTNKKQTSIVSSANKQTDSKVIAQSPKPPVAPEKTVTPKKSNSTVVSSAQPRHKSAYTKNANEESEMDLGDIDDIFKE